MASIKGNIILNGINTLTGILFPVVTFPYAARVLLPDGIGAINFLNSVIAYIVLLTSLGIPMYAVKEIAKYRGDKINRDKIAIEILLLSFILCLIGYVFVWCLAEFVPQIHKQAGLFYVLSLTIVFTSIGVNWFYQGIEDFKFITIRAIVVRTLSAICLFIFVHNPSDLLIYGVITVGATVGNNVVNFIHLRKHIDLARIKINSLNIKRHIRPSVEVFILNLIISLYIQLNSIMLGLISGDDSVGFFTAGTKISHIGLTIIGSLGAVLLPRCSHLLKEGKRSEFASLISKSVNLTLALSYPMTIGMMVLCRPITIVFCGNEYEEAISILFLNAPVIIFISLTNLMGIQILYPMDKIRIVIWSVSGGAVINLVLNLVLLPKYGAFGAAVSTLFAEFVVLVIQMIYGRTYFPFKLSLIVKNKYLLASLIMGICIWGCVYNIPQNSIQLIVGVLIGVLSYFAILVHFKDNLTIELISEIKRRIKK